LKKKVERAEREWWSFGVRELSSDLSERRERRDWREGSEGVLECWSIGNLETSEGLSSVKKWV